MMGIRPYTNSDKMLSCEDVACVVTARKEVNSSTEIKSAEFFCFLESMQTSFISLVREVEHFFSRPASLRVPAFFVGGVGGYFAASFVSVADEPTALPNDFLLRI